MVLYLVAALTVASASEGTDVFELDIDELSRIPISAASRLALEATKQPASVTIITRRQVETSGARTLSDVIALFTPGYFRTEDQDDVIAGFRGLSPDNNSKVLFLIDGKAVNTEWFWGAPDAILNGQDLDWIERIEIVRGPGSAILGQGALLGVINIISTNSNFKVDTARVRAIYGENAQRQIAVNWRVSSDAGMIDGYLSEFSYNGERMADDGWIRDRETEFGSVYALNHHLQRANGDHHAIRFTAKDFVISYRDVMQRRDLYNFYRERNEVEQNLKLVEASYKNTFGTALLFSLDWQHNTDDYDLYSHHNVDMGGVRERRNTLQMVVRPDITEEIFQWLVGAEKRVTQSGLSNAQGDNYIINEPNALMGNSNQINTYVYKNEISVESIFAESSVAVDARHDIYVGARLDNHPKWGRKLTPRASWFYKLAADQQFRLSYQQGFRGAVGVHYSGGFRGDGLLSEANFNRVDENSDLSDLGFRDIGKTEPEEIRGWELSYSRAPDNPWHWSVTAFQNTVRNIIDVGVIYVDPNVLDITNHMIGSDRAGSWNGFFFFKNTPGELTSRGLETEFVYEQGALQLRASHAYVDARDASYEQSLGSMYLVQSASSLHFKAYPENVFRLSVQYEFADEWSVTYSHVQATSWWSPAGEKQAGVGWGNMSLVWQPTNKLRWQLVLKNVFDESALYPINNNADDALLSQSGTPALQGREARVVVTFGSL